ncbi:MAG: GNAT family N-acetyltransferase [Deltaproteobacteria bacterium]
MAEPQHLEELRGAAAFALLREEWGRLAERAETPIFRRWEWLFPWWSRFGGGGTPLLLAARDPAGALRGLLPLSSERALGGLVRLRLLGDRLVGSDGLGPLIEPDGRAEVEEAFASWLAEAMGSWDLLELRELDAGESFGVLVEARLRRAGANVARRASCRCPTSQLTDSLAGDPPGTFDAFLEGRPRRDNLIRRRKWLERQPSFRIDCATAPDEVGPALDRFLAIHERRWGSRWSDAIPGPAVEGFHREAARLLAERSRCRIYLAWLQGRPVAGVYALAEGDRFYYYLPVFDPAWGHRSVGLVLLGHVLERATTEGFRRFEFLRGEESYKADWSDGSWETFSLEASAPRIAPHAFGLGRLGIAQARSVAGRALPEGVVRRWRQVATGHTLKTVGNH